MSKRTRRERRLGREARTARPKAQGELSAGQSGEKELLAETPASASRRPRLRGGGGRTNPRRAAPAAPVTRADLHSPTHEVDRNAPLQDPSSTSRFRSRRSTDEERVSPVEFELVMVEERAKKAQRKAEKRTSRVRVDEEPGQELEASAERLARARDLVREGKIEEAMELYREIVSDHPQSLKARNNLGVLYDELGQHERALEQFEIARALCPDNVEVLSNMGVGAARSLPLRRRRARAAPRAEDRSRKRGGTRQPRDPLPPPRANTRRRRPSCAGCASAITTTVPPTSTAARRSIVWARWIRRWRCWSAPCGCSRPTTKIYHTMGILFDKKHMPVEAAQMYRKMRELRS